METLTEKDINLENKTIPDSIQEATIKALLFYPELSDVSIEFRFDENIKKSVMQAQPKFVTMYGSRRWRSYLIKISRWFTLKGKQISILELPEDVLIGWIGHELGHIKDYTKRNTWSMLLFGVGYLTSKSFIISAERVADTYAVENGLGDYILSTKNFILHEAGMSESYLKKIDKLYMSPEEIIDLMEDRRSDDF